MSPSASPCGTSNDTSCSAQNVSESSLGGRAARRAGAQRAARARSPLRGASVAARGGRRGGSACRRRSAWIAGAITHSLRPGRRTSVPSGGSRATPPTSSDARRTPTRAASARGLPAPSSAQRKPSTTPAIGLSPYSGRHALGDEAARVGDGRREQPQLGEERDRVPHVAVLDVQRGEPEPDAERRRRARAARAGHDQEPRAAARSRTTPSRREGRRTRSRGRRGLRAPARAGWEPREVDLRDQMLARRRGCWPTGSARRRRTSTARARRG